jgi:hypothetical protein
MSATVVRERNQTTLPADVLAAAGVRVKDQVDWTFEDGKIVGRKLVPAKTKDGRVIGLVKRNGWLMLSEKPDKKDVLAAIRADREGK